MRLMIFGSRGQLGRCLLPMLADHQIMAPGSDELDFLHRGAITDLIRSAELDFVINLAAYTAVDKAESEPEQSNAINHLAVAEMAKACHEQHLPLLHLSTDFVFSGGQSTPYKTTDPCNPIGQYGRSKHAGEQAILERHGDNSVILRTAWLYSDVGSNFLLTMLRLMKERKQLGIVADQVGTPTSAYSLARTITALLTERHNGIFHWTDAGVASWYDFAVAIYEEALARQLVPEGVTILPIATSQYPTPAKRPAFSVLDKSVSYETLALPAVHWRQEIRQVLDKIAAQPQ